MDLFLPFLPDIIGQMNGNGRRSQFISNLLILLMFCIIDDLKEEFVFILAKPQVKKCSTKTFNHWVLYFND